MGVLSVDLQEWGSRSDLGGFGLRHLSVSENGELRLIWSVWENGEVTLICQVGKMGS